MKKKGGLRTAAEARVRGQARDFENKLMLDNNFVSFDEFGL